MCSTMNILLLLITHSAWSFNVCSYYRSKCEADQECQQQIRNYIIKCSTAPEDEQRCSCIARRITEYFGEGCMCAIDPNINCTVLKSRSRHLSNKKNCAQFPKDDLDEHNERETRISRSISGSSNVDIIDGVSGALPSVISGTHSFSMDNDDMLRRATRSPLSQQIQLWKNELSGELLHGAISLENFSCNRALYDVCLKHVSCRQLWNIFRSSCAVDASNQCIMSDRDDCWQSFEGISWTGLGNCTCFDTNSDCHWIRLQTRYNKCIYEIGLSGKFPTSFPSHDLFTELERIPKQHRIVSDPRQSTSAASESRQPPSGDIDHSMSTSQTSGLTSGTINGSTSKRTGSLPRSNGEDSQSVHKKQLQNVTIERKQTVSTASHNRYKPERQDMEAIQNQRHRQRVRPLLQPPSTRQKSSQPSTSLSESKVLQHSDVPTTSRPSQTVHFLVNSQQTAPPSNSDSNQSANMQPETKNRQLQIGVTQAIVKVDRAVSSSSKSPRPFSSSDRTPPKMPTNDNESSLSSDVSTSEMSRNAPRKNSQLQQQKQAQRASAYERRIRWETAERSKTTATNVLIKGKPPLRSAVSASKKSETAVTAQNSTQSSGGAFDTSYDDTKGSEMKKQQYRNEKSKQQSLWRTQTSNVTERHSSLTRFTTEAPITSIPQPPLEKNDIRWSSDIVEYSDVPRTTFNQSLSQSSNASSHTVVIKSNDLFRQKNSSDSTCVSAHHRCERFDTCKWHLSEVQIRCTGQCNRQQCAAAIQRFIRYVARPSVESLMFCQCSLEDKECLEYQQVMYPRCLYTDRDQGPLTCTEAVEKCRNDNHCQRFSSVFFHYCPVRNGRCTISQLDHCRQALIAIRGSYLEYPCYCPQNDPVCRNYQSGMLPNNPCVERAMFEYTALMSNTHSMATHKDSKIEHRKTDNVEENRRIDNDEEIRNDHERRDPQVETAVTPSSYRTQWNAAISNNRYETYPSRSTHDSNEQRNVPDTDNGHLMKSVSVISPDQKYYYESNGDIQKSARPDESRTINVAAQPETRRVIAEEVVSKPAGSSHHQNHASDPFETSKGEHTKTFDMIVEQSASAKSKNVFSSPRIVGKTYLSASDHLEDADVMPQQTTSTTSTVTPFLLITQKHRNTTAAMNGSSSSSSVLPKSPKSATKKPVKLTTSDYITHAPPPLGGCITKDVNGNVIRHYKGSIIRRYHDWSGRCSSWCRCSQDERLTCSRLPCLPDGECNAPLTKMGYGERLYVKDRGACTCQSGVFICDQPEELPELGPGIYLLVGYSLDEVAMLKETVPKNALERSGFVSEDSFVAHDIGSRLQIALERIMPQGVQCRIMFLDEFKSEGNIIFQMEWFGVNRLLNETVKRWHTGQAEKVCSLYVKQLADAISRNEALRFQLVLSTVKQIRVVDLLHGLPASAVRLSSSTLSFQLPILLFLLGGVHRILVS